MKTSELIGPALDWAVAKCERIKLAPQKQRNAGLLEFYPYEGGLARQLWSPSTDWSQGGPIIEREEIDVYCVSSPKHGEPGKWLGEITGTAIRKYGPTPLIAAMRCYVASKFGDEVDTPKELL